MRETTDMVDELKDLGNGLIGALRYRLGFGFGFSLALDFGRRRFGLSTDNSHFAPDDQRRHGMNFVR